MCVQERILEELRIQSEGSHSLAAKQALINGLEAELVEAQKGPLSTLMIGPGIPEARDRMATGERARRTERQRIVEKIRKCDYLCPECIDVAIAVIEGDGDE